ncbi:MAG: hypothetical protein H7Z71_02465 [Moraxellaceae bacterium]|nr:hypothetical protein [Pseudobdellovibrionaceae bacterium]
MKKIIVCILIFSSLAQADTYNFRFSPIHAIVGYVNTNLDIAVSPNWTLGPSLGLWNFNSSSTTSSNSSNSYNYRIFALGARANWFANEVYKDGLVVGPNIEFMSIDVKSKSTTSDLSGKVTATILGCYVGYGWFWQSFNQMLSGGIRTVGSTKVKIEDSSGSTVDEASGVSNTGLTLEYTLGWTF